MTIRGRRLFEGSDYSRAATYSRVVTIRRNVVSAVLVHMEVKNWQSLGNRTLGSWLEQELMMMKKMCAQLSKQVELQMK